MAAKHRLASQTKSGRGICGLGLAIGDWRRPALSGDGKTAEMVFFAYFSILFLREFGQRDCCLRNERSMFWVL